MRNINAFKKLYARLFVPFLLAVLSINAAGASWYKTEAATCFQAAAADSEKFRRTELYFGRSKPDGSDVSDYEWKDFLDREVTPRFPDGFTVLEGFGQYRDKSGAIMYERSKVLVILYPRKTRKAANEKIEAIRAAYVRLFNQESVLRMDLPRSVQVSF